MRSHLILFCGVSFVALSLVLVPVLFALHQFGVTNDTMTLEAVLKDVGPLTGSYVAAMAAASSLNVKAKNGDGENR
jgi:type IV secretory pathway VirB3-like protein